MEKHDLSKSKLTLFEQCAKRLWLYVHRRDLIEIDAATEARFATGHAVGELACTLHADGVMVDIEPGIDAALSQTAALISAASVPIFEATFQHQGVLVRVDIMLPDGAGGWQVAEVKSTGSRKDYQLGDLATQIWVIEGAGVTVSNAAIRHIDTGFVLTRPGDFRGFFRDAESLAEIRPTIAGRADVVGEARAMLSGGEPEIEPGAHCDAPFTCDFKAYCNQGRRIAEWPISLLPRTGAKLAETFAAKGVGELTDLAAGDLANAVHERIRLATVSGVPFHDVAEARRLTKDWAYPRTYLDFETINPAVPRWTGSRPFQQIPFQFSAHIETPDGALAHREFLSLDGDDPRLPFAEALLREVPKAGAIVVYNATFERSRILELAGRFPEHAVAFRNIAARLVDLEPVTRATWYHRDQRESWSIKRVLPTIGEGASYDALDVQDGMEAQSAYFEAISPSVSPDRRDAIAQSLLEYCALDTLAMVNLLRHLVQEPVGAA